MVWIRLLPTIESRYQRTISVPR